MRVLRSRGPAKDVHPVAPVAVLGVRGRDVDEPSALQDVQFGGPEVRAVGGVWRGSPVGTVRHQIPFMAVRSVGKLM